jgi:hypothetical protein
MSTLAQQVWQVRQAWATLLDDLGRGLRTKAGQMQNELSPYEQARRGDWTHHLRAGGATTCGLQRWVAIEGHHASPNNYGAVTCPYCVAALPPPLLA